jgi:hypothetical protein
MSYLRLIIFVALLGACAPIVPAKTPPQLAHTPGAFVVVTDDTFDAGIFSVDYPQSWRVVKTSIASTPFIQVVFVTPDDSSITLTQTETTDNSSNADERFITLDNDVVIQVLMTPSDDADENFNDLAKQLISSIRSNFE